jgi:predicted HTH transcriptional regulator
MEDLRLTKCLTAKRESKSIEFKEQFQPSDSRQALEVLKDIVAIANSGGGALAVGINNLGEASGADVSATLRHDHAKYCDLVHKYTLHSALL